MRTHMTCKRPFLMASARRLTGPVDIGARYNEEQQVNVSHGRGRPIPLALDAGVERTGSKTESLSRDDDPDPEAEGCC